MEPDSSYQPILLYDRNVNKFANRSLTTRQGQWRSERTITFEEAFSQDNLRKIALQFHRNSLRTPMQLPIEFTQFVLHKVAINERGCRHFDKKLPLEMRNCLKSLIGKKDSDIETKQVHQAGSDKPSGFRGIFVKFFFRKVIYNLRDEPGRYEYCENFATIFPFQVLKEVPVEYDIDVGNQFDDEFYTQIQAFLDDHFEGIDVRHVGRLFLANIHHFRQTGLPEKALFNRVLRNSSNEEGRGDSSALGDSCLSSFPRLSEEGVSRFHELYDHYKTVCKVFDDVDVSMDKYGSNYLRNLPESNFADLYDLLNVNMFSCRRKAYIKMFKKYLFFFLHALDVTPNPVFFIDDVLFKCLKCLHRFKSSRQDLTLFSDIAKLSLVHLRTKFSNEFDSYLCTSNVYPIEPIEPTFLQDVKSYIESIPNIEAVQIDVEYRTNYLHGWMLFRNADTCYEMCYSKKKRRYVNDFVGRVLCSILAPDNEPIKYVVIYNSFKGQESRMQMPRDVETIRNFVRLSNKYDFANDTHTELNDEFLTRDLHKYFDHLTVTD